MLSIPPAESIVGIESAIVSTIAETTIELDWLPAASLVTAQKWRSPCPKSAIFDSDNTYSYKPLPSAFTESSFIVAPEISLIKEMVL